MSWYSSGQNDQNIRYWLLDSAHGSYETRRAAIESLSPNYTIDNGSVANTKVVRGYATNAEIASNNLDIGGAVLDRVHNFVNAHAAVPTIHTSIWGDKIRMWGKFPEQPQALPTTPIDRIVQHWKDGGEAILYVNEDGAGDGSSYASPLDIHDICAGNPALAAVDPTDYDIIVVCGMVGRHVNQGAQGGLTDGSTFKPKTGTSGSRTIVMSHPADTAICMGGSRLGSGAGSDGAWSNDSGNRWVTVNTSGAGAGQPFGNGFAIYFDGTDLIPLTKVASAAAVASTSMSFHFEASDAEDPGSAGSKAWVNIGGPDPTNSVYFGCFVGGGVSPDTNVQYVDYYGLRHYQVVLRPTESGSNARFYGCYWGYGTVYFRSVESKVPVVATGAMSGITNTENCLFVGCETEFFPAGFYNSGGASEVCEQGLTIYDHYFHNIGLPLARSYGVGITLPGDNHCVATYGAIIGLYARNLRMKDVAAECAVLYINAVENVVPSGGLETTQGYTIAWPRDKVYIRPSDGKECYVGACRNNYVGHVWASDFFDGSGMICSFNGDGTYDGTKTQLVNNIMEYWFIEDTTGAATDSAARCKWMLNIDDGADHRTNVMRYITARGVATGGYVFFTLEDEEGDTVEASAYFHHLDIHATDYFIRTINRSFATKRKREFDYSTFRTDGGAVFDRGAGETGNLAWWQGQDGNPLGNDIQDPNSTATTLSTDTGSPTLTISGTGTATASFGADPDGAISSLQYQWRVNGALIAGAEATTFDYSLYPDGAELDCIAEGVDAKGKWFIVTSNTITIANDIGRSGMFGHRYFGARYFGPRYFGPALAAAAAGERAQRGGFMVNVGGLLSRV